MSDRRNYFWQTPQFAIWTLTTLVALCAWSARGYVTRLETVEEVLPRVAVAESDVKTLRDGQDKILNELRDINKWLRGNRP